MRAASVFRSIIVSMTKTSVLAAFVVAAVATFLVTAGVLAQTAPTPAPRARTVTPTSTPTPEAASKPDLTKETAETLGPLEKLLKEQKIGPVYTNPLKHAIRAAVEAGVPANTIVLLLLLPVVAAVIAATRQLIGLRGFGIFLPAALSVVFISTGPVAGIGLFLVIVFVATLARMVLRTLRIKLQYLPRMALLLLFVVLGVLGILFLSPLTKRPDLTGVSIFPVLILVLLAEDFSKVQIGKSIKTAINLTTETLVLALVSYLFLTFTALQRFALTNPEILIVSVGVFDFLLGRYVGLRFIEYWRFRKLISE